MRALLWLLAGTPLFAQVAVPTAQYDNSRTNSNRSEQILNVSNVNPASFGKLFVRAVDGVLYAEPLYLPNISIPGKGVHNVVYCATMQNTVYAFDADDPAASTALWSTNLGTPVFQSGSVLAMPAGGILSTPAIDTASGTLYTVAQTQAPSGAPQISLNALDIHTGSHKTNSPMAIQASVSGSTEAPDRDSSGNVALEGASTIQRAGLLVVNGSVYVALDASLDLLSLPYHGWLLRYDASTLQLVGVFITTLNGVDGGLWQMGRGAAADASGNVYVVSANGDYDGVTNFGQSILKFTGPGLTLADWFTPADNVDTTNADLDFGLNGPILVPGTNLVVAGGKDGMVYVANQSSLGQLQNAGAPVQSFQAAPYCDNADCYHQEALWARSSSPILYVWEEYDVVRGYRLIGGQFETVPFSTGHDVLTLPAAGMTVSSNGDDPNTAILWAMGPVDNGNDPRWNFVPMTVRAYNALDLTNELWDSSMNDARDDPGDFAKYAAPVVANGKVYVPTFSNQLAVYGLLAASPVTIQTSPPGLSFTVDSGTAQTAPQTLNLSQGTHTITVAETQAGPAGTQYAFTGWSDGGSASHNITVGSIAATYTASFKTQYSLTISALPVAGGTVTPASGAFYDSGTAVPIVATANSGYGFSGWSGGVASAGSATTTVTMGGPQTVTANFSFLCILTVSSPGVSLSAIGTSSNGFSPSAPQGFTLTPNAGCAGVSWSATTADVSPASATPSAFVSITSGASGSGTGATAIGFNAFANTHLAGRSATITITATAAAPVSFAINEAGSTQSMLNRETQALYQRSLGREPDSGGFSFWTCITPATVSPCANLGVAGLGLMVDGFLTSPPAYEGRNTDFQVLALYQAILGRMPLFAEWSNAIGPFRVNDTPAGWSAAATALLGTLVNSTEYAGRYGSPGNTSNAIANLYQNTLNRQPTGGELASGTTTVGNSGLIGLFSAIFGGAEFQNIGAFASTSPTADHSNRMFVTMMYFSVLARDPDPGGYAFWVGIANSGGAGIYFQAAGSTGASTRILIEGPGTPNVGLVGSIEFQGLFAN